MTKRALQARGVFCVHCEIFPSFIHVGILELDDNTPISECELFDVDNPACSYRVQLPNVKSAYQIDLQRLG